MVVGWGGGKVGAIRLWPGADTRILEDIILVIIAGQGCWGKLELIGALNLNGRPRVLLGCSTIRTLYLYSQYLTTCTYRLECRSKCGYGLIHGNCGLGRYQGNRYPISEGNRRSCTEGLRDLKLDGNQFQQGSGSKSSFGRLLKKCCPINDSCSVIRNIFRCSFEATAFDILRIQVS